MFDWIKIGAAFMLTFIPSACGILWAVFISGNKEDAFRGGAIGTTFSLVFVFLSRNYGMQLYEAAVQMEELNAERRRRRAKSLEPTGESAVPITPTIEDVALNLATLRAALIVDDHELRTLNKCLACTTLIAAFVCAFGDRIATHWINARLHH